MATPTAPAASAPTTPQPAAGSAAPAPGAQPGAAKPAAGATQAEIRKLKLKLEGQDVELPESEVIALAQQGKTAGKRFQEAAEIRRKAEEILKLGNENPAEFFKKTGKNPRQWAEDFLMAELQREAMTPEQKKAADNEALLKQYEKEKKDLKAAQEAAAQEELRKQHHDNYDKLFVDALNKCGLPKTKYTVKRMAELQLVNIKKKLELPADKLAQIVREDYIAEQKELFGAAEGDQILEMLGPDIVKKLSKAQIAKLKAKGVPTSSRPATAGGGDGKTGQLTWKEYQRRNRRLP